MHVPHVHADGLRDHASGYPQVRHDAGGAPGWYHGENGVARLEDALVAARELVMSEARE